ncbi:unnamed protein product [Adineta steineri]|uniref:Dienelactone hydrolase domain-containing protein n=1 Tax=Adineta steineri TaxID=433720 RepID=A0A816BWU6_9BILA|nr:unnamed protein product [Adineta steineri]CAF1615055.1 unnamed protein product [Adineta steineri]
MSGPCCVDPGAKQSHEVCGRMEEIGGVNTYKTGEGKSAIVIFTDVFGNSFVNVQKIADTFAENTQTTVVIPDYFNGDPIDANVPNLMEVLPAWLKKHPTKDTCLIAEKFISTIKQDYQSIQIMGFCYGAKSVVHLLIHPEFSSIIKGAVVAHPSFLVKEEATQIKQSILFLCAENDQIFTPDLREEFEKELKSNHYGKFIDYPGTIHGFVVRPHDSPQAYQQRDKAIQDAIQYFKQNI